MTITTKGGDRGSTALKDRRVSKADAIIVALGDLDECSSLIILTQATHRLDLSIWQPIVDELYQISAVLAGFKDSVDLDAAIRRLELAIQAKAFITSKFIFPFDQAKNAQLHYLRSVVRRAERSCVAVHEHHPIQESILIYINRLSDFVFSCEL